MRNNHEKEWEAALNSIAEVVTKIAKDNGAFIHECKIGIMYDAQSGEVRMASAQQSMDEKGNEIGGTSRSDNLGEALRQALQGIKGTLAGGDVGEKPKEKEPRIEEPKVIVDNLLRDLGLGG